MKNPKNLIRYGNFYSNHESSTKIKNLVPESKRSDFKYIWRSSFKLDNFEKHEIDESTSEKPNFLKHGNFNFNMSLNSTKHEILSLSPRRKINNSNINKNEKSKYKSNIPILKNLRSLSSPSITKQAKHHTAQKLPIKINLGQIEHLPKEDKRSNLPWCLNLREKREKTASLSLIPINTINNEVHNRLYETPIKSHDIHLADKFKSSMMHFQNGHTCPMSVTLSPHCDNINGTTQRSGFGFNSIISNGSIGAKKWVNSSVQSPKFTSHNFPDCLPTDLISHFYKTNDEKFKTSSFISLNTENDNNNKSLFNSKIEDNKTFKQAKFCSKNHMQETDLRFKSDIYSVLSSGDQAEYNDDFMKKGTTCLLRYVQSPGKNINNYKFEFGLRNYHT